MKDRIWIAPPMHRWPDGATASRPIEVLLVDGNRILGEVQNLIAREMKENRQIKAIVLGAVAYLSLEEHVGDFLRRMGPSGPDAHLFGEGSAHSSGLDAFVLNGVRFMIDPTRDGGAPVVLYDWATGLDMFALRKVREREAAKLNPG